MKTDRNKVIIKCALMALLLLVCDIMIFLLYVSGFLPVFLLVLLHGCVFIAACVFVFFCKKNGDDLLYPLMIPVNIFGLGAFGSFGFLVQLALASLYSLYAKPAHIWLIGLFPKPKETKFQTILQRVQSKWDDYEQPTAVSSFQDVFQIGTLAQKQAVLDAIAKEFKPEYSPVLRLGLEDSQNVVRIQAAAIVSKVSLDLEQKLNRYQQEYQMKPHKASLLPRLAYLCDTFAMVEIIDVFRRKEMAEFAIQYYQKMIVANPDDREASLAIGRILFFKEQFNEYLVWYKEYQKKFKEVPEFTHDRFLEAAYRLKKFNEYDATSGESE